MSITFQKAVRQFTYYKMAVVGPSGSGKTYSAISIAQGLGDKIAVIDTEKGSSNYYSHLGDFDVAVMSPPFHPKHYIEGIRQAQHMGYEVLIIDSLSHAWSGQGGLLEMKSELATSPKFNDFTAWNKVTPWHNKLLDAIIQAELHIIVTMRTKTEYVIENIGGKQVPRKVGLAPIQRDGVDFEFATVLLLTREHIAHVDKDRTGLFEEPFTPDKSVGEKIKQWLNGAEPTVRRDSQSTNEDESLVSDDIPFADNDLPFAEKKKPATKKVTKPVNKETTPVRRDSQSTNKPVTKPSGSVAGKSLSELSQIIQGFNTVPELTAWYMANRRSFSSNNQAVVNLCKSKKHSIERKQIANAVKNHNGNSVSSKKDGDSNPDPDEGQDSPRNANGKHGGGNPNVPEKKDADTPTRTAGKDNPPSKLHNQNANELDELNDGDKNENVLLEELDGLIAKVAQAHDIPERDLRIYNSLAFLGRILPASAMFETALDMDTPVIKDLVSKASAWYDKVTPDAVLHYIEVISGLSDAEQTNLLRNLGVKRLYELDPENLKALDFLLDTMSQDR